MKPDLLIGIDGGGTHSTALAAFPNGAIAGTTDGKGLNFHNIGIEAVRGHLNDMVNALCLKFGAQSPAVCVGMSALDGPADPHTLSLFETGPIPPGQLDLQSDAHIALMSHTLGQPGMIAICGTGSMLLLIDRAGREQVSGGWGYLLGDRGSGYTLAREGLLAVIDQTEGLGPATPLTGDALTFFRVERARQLIDAVYAPSASPDLLAGFARFVLQHAAENEPVSLDILARNMRGLAVQAARLLNRAPEADRVGLYGGIFAHSAQARALFTQALTREAPAAKVALLARPPEFGALVRLFKRVNPTALDHLRASYEATYHDRSI